VHSTPLLNVPAMDAFVALPLPNLAFESDSFGAGGLHIARLGYADWMLLEKTTIAEEYLAEYCRQPRFFCIIPQPFGFLGSDDVRNLQTALAVEQARLFAMAVRFQLRDIFPDLTHYVVYAREKGRNFRSPGRYRSSWFGEPATTTHRLKHEDVLGIEAGMSLLTVYGCSWTTTNGGLALRNFGGANAPEMDAGERIQLLLVALVAMFGEMDERIGRATLARRVAAACRVAGLAETGTEEFVARQLRQTRNFVFHGIPSRHPLPDVFTKLFTIVSACLPAFLRFCCTYPATANAIADVLRTSDPLTPFIAFNALLARAGFGDTDAVALVTPDPHFEDVFCMGFQPASGS
jgi:hypothetical protein